ncbi:MAG: TIGR01212 family radical SAM protein [Prolixibacteraceae bacterium]|nr:TIGR01212 family radical SAM protein [Prolixibacteraceae bacterium]
MTGHTTNFTWGHSKPYNDFPSYFRQLFSERVQKVSIDAGFTCPNRDGSVGTGGCIYCNNITFQPTYCNLAESVSSQIDRGIRFFSERYRAVQFLAYFQAYTNTYAPLDDLIALYEEALAHPQIVGLVIATRPDCLPDAVLDYLAKIAENHYVMVEVGVESCENRTLKLINRGHTFETTVDAFHRLAERNLHSCAHLIIGLPGEDRETVLNQARIISQLPVQQIKLHQLQVHEGTRLAQLYRAGVLVPDLYETVEDYIAVVVEYLELLRPDIVVERFVSQAPSSLLIKPRWGIKNHEFLAKIEKALKTNNTWQGRLYKV